MSEVITTYKDSDLKELQAVEASFLKSVASFFDSNDITWFLDSGTALGAVRHHGFIPWDDDVDLGMLRADYEKLIRLVHERKLPSEWDFAEPGVTDGFAGMFAKICLKGTRFETEETIDANYKQGIFIDIFVYDVLSADENIRKRQIDAARREVRLSYLYYSRHINVPGAGLIGLAQKAMCFCAHYLVKVFMSQKRMSEKFYKACTLGLDNPSNEFLTMAYPYIPAIPGDILFPTSFEQFEGTTYPVPGQTAKYLEIMYGDSWQQLPPQNKRKTHAPIVLDLGDGINRMADE